VRTRGKWIGGGEGPRGPGQRAPSAAPRSPRLPVEAAAIAVPPEGRGRFSPHPLGFRTVKGRGKKHGSLYGNHSRKKRRQRDHAPALPAHSPPPPGDVGVLGEGEGEGLPIRGRRRVQGVEVGAAEGRLEAPVVVRPQRPAERR